MVKAGCYAVARGRVPGIYMEWSDCEAQVINFKGAKYKKFFHAADAELWVHQNAVGAYAAKTSPVAASRAAPQADVSSPEARESSSPQAPSAKPASSSAKTRTASSSFRDGERARSEERRVIPQHSTPSSTGSREGVINTMSSNTLIVFTDGSCIGNGKVGPVAGIGVWWGKDDPRNISQRCPGHQTNNRAELIAIIRVLETAPKDRPLLIKSDSEYSIKSMTQWICTWKTRGWRTSTGSAVQNLPVIKYLDVLLEERRRVLKQSVQFEKVPAHSGLEGNEGADVLAKAGATLPPVPDPDWEALAQKVYDRIDAVSSIQASTARRPGSVPRTLPSPQKTQVQRVPSQPAATLSQALAKPSPPPATPKEKPPPSSTLHSSRASSTTPRQSSAWQAPRSTSSALTSTSTSTPTSTVTSTSERIPRIPLSLNDVAVHGSLDVKISQEEKEAFAACWLDDDDFLREAQEAGLHQSLYVLKTASGEAIQATQEEFINSRQWGCSCGQHTNGWLSPRMRYRLKWTAEVTGDTMMLDSEAILTRRQRLFDGLGIEFLPETYQDGGVSKSFNGGYTDAVRAVARVLQKPGRDGLPPVPNLVEEFGHRTVRFLSGGADAAHQALSDTLFTPMEESPLGDKTWDDMQEELAEEGDALSAQYTSLPKCANDLGFTRVAERTGLPDLERFQGYSSRRDYCMDVDDMGFRDDNDEEEEDDGW